MLKAELIKTGKKYYLRTLTGSPNLPSYYEVILLTGEFEEGDIFFYSNYSGWTGKRADVITEQMSTPINQL